MKKYNKFQSKYVVVPDFMYNREPIVFDSRSKMFRYFNMYSIKDIKSSVGKVFKFAIVIL